MTITPHDWSVVVIGHWNRAILTPVGIVQRLFRLPEKTPVEVEVALDAFVPYSVRHENVVVMVDSDKLHVRPHRYNYDAFSEAMAVARAGLENLPETPVFAAGFNLNFKTADSVESLTVVTGHLWDERLSDEGFKIEARSTARALIWKDGRIRIMVTQEADMSFSIALNFDLRSTSAPNLIKWLSLPIQDIKTTTERILSRCLELALEDILYVS